MPRFLFGDFDHRVTVGAFRPDPQAMAVQELQHGLPLQATWLYGFFRDTATRSDERGTSEERQRADNSGGLISGIERKFVGSLTSGCFVMSQSVDGKLDAAHELNVHPDSGRSARGELRRVLDGPERRWHEPVFQRLPAGTVPAGEQPLDLRWTGDTIAYSEGDILDLSGPRAGLGVQFYVASRTNPMLYTSTCHWVSGMFQGRAVEGPLWMDNSYWVHGLEWKEYGYFNGLQVAWHVFCNKFTDGTFEWGHLVMGREGFTPGIVVSGDEVVAATPDLRATFSLDAGAWPESATFDLGDEVYAFSGPATGRMTQFSASRWANYRAQFGQTRQVGDTRELVDGHTWLEAFADRIREDGLEK